MGVSTFEYRKFLVLVILIMILIQKYQLRYIPLGRTVGNVLSYLSK